LTAIQEITASPDLKKCAEVIASVFRTVADEFGLTEANCPSHPAFVTVATLRELNDRGAALFGVYDTGELLGCVAVERADQSIWYVEKLAVLPAHRHAGLGRRLMEFAFDYVRGQGGKVVSIAIIDENRVLKGWYASLGFTETGSKRFPHLPFTVCFMEKPV
jgi:GNAT superfamily N-acetyltransferase